MIEHCKRCDLCLQNNFKPPKGTGSLSGNILIIIDLYNERYIKEIQSALYVAGFYPTDYYITSLIKCKTKTDIHDVYYNKCKPYLDIELKLPFKVIIPFGVKPYNSIFNFNPPNYFNKTIHKIIQIDGKYVLPTYNPFVTVKQNQYELFSELFELLDMFYREVIDINHKNNVQKVLNYKVNIKTNKN